MSCAFLPAPRAMRARPRRRRPKATSARPLYAGKLTSRALVLGLGGGRRGGERVLQSRLLSMVERGAQHFSADALELLEHLVGGHLLDEEEQRGGAVLQIRADFLHEVVVDAGVGQGAADRARRRADRGADERHQEDQADQGAPRAPDAAPIAVVLTSWLSLTAPLGCLTAMTASPTSIK